MSEKRDWEREKNGEDQGRSGVSPNKPEWDRGDRFEAHDKTDRDRDMMKGHDDAADGEELKRFIERDLLPELELASVNPTEPIVVRKQPSSWIRLGAGNYAGVFTHPKLADWVVKVYAPGREGFEAETEVYRRLGEHPAFASCKLSAEAGGHRYLVLKRLRGKTLYQCMLDCTRIAPRVIADIDEALDYARSKGLYPHDVHGKNVMQHEGRGIVVDVSDFLKTEPCRMWDDLKNAYHRVYVPYLSKLPFPIPEWMMDGVRKGYRLFRGNRKQR
ncbi:serine/threonine protein kinase [Paenibacillus aurantiacus]|uniref:Serine/threonine protein kinase n=1 Tax=Paenibacillus aurantiacus TaxID=1936118 RepID=A0ABV5KNT7_9BACL